MNNWNEVFEAVKEDKEVFFIADEKRYGIRQSGHPGVERFYIRHYPHYTWDPLHYHYFATIDWYNSEVIRCYTTFFFELVETEIRFEYVTIEQEEPEVDHV